MPTGLAAACSTGSRPPYACITSRTPRKPSSGEARREAAQVALDDRAEPGVQRDGRHALVLADDRRDLVREREEDVGREPPDDALDELLGLGVGERPQQADAERRDARVEQAQDSRLDLGLVGVDVDPPADVRRARGCP